MDAHDVVGRELDAVAEALRPHDAVKYGAYRTAFKLRTLQTRLGLDRVTLNQLSAAFDHYRLDARSGCYVGFDVMLACIGFALDERIAVAASLPQPSQLPQSPQPAPRTSLLRSPEPTVASATAAAAGGGRENFSAELLVCWLLDVYDRTRRRRCVPVLSFKVGLVLLCRAPVEDKFRHLFSSVDEIVRKRLDEIRLTELLAACLKMVEYLGESSSFCGTDALNLSVRSCMEEADSDDTLTCASFLSWLRLAPQSIVWMDVFHRVAMSDGYDHGMQCKICCRRVIGLRYRCLRCFRFNMCQSCFLEKKDVPRHGGGHPIEEYYCSKSGEDIMMCFATLQETEKERTSSDYIRRYHPRSYLPLPS